MCAESSSEETGEISGTSVVLSSLCDADSRSHCLPQGQAHHGGQGAMCVWRQEESAGDPLVGYTVTGNTFRNGFFNAESGEAFQSGGGLLDTTSSGPFTIEDRDGGVYLDNRECKIRDQAELNLEPLDDLPARCEAEDVIESVAIVDGVYGLRSDDSFDQPQDNEYVMQDCDYAQNVESNIQIPNELQDYGGSHVPTNERFSNCFNPMHDSEDIYQNSNTYNSDVGAQSGFHESSADIPENSSSIGFPEETPWRPSEELTPPSLGHDESERVDHTQHPHDEESHRGSRNESPRPSNDHQSHNEGQTQRSNEDQMPEAPQEEHADTTGEEQTMQTPSLDDLGIITSQPKQFDFRLKQARLGSFADKWPKDDGVRSEDLAGAGFYFRGPEDCATCFYCGGTLKGWEPGDDPRVEHSRFFPLCDFLRMSLGAVFVQAVQTLHHQGQEKISFEDALHVVSRSISVDLYQLGDSAQRLRSDPAVRALVDIGYPQHRVLEAASWLEKRAGIPPSSQRLLFLLTSNGDVETVDLLNDQTLSRHFGVDICDDETMRIQEETEALRSLMACKVCLDNPIQVVFLPCGHFVSCVDCACALNTCPICRDDVKATVRAYTRNS